MPFNLSFKAVGALKKHRTSDLIQIIASGSKIGETFGEINFISKYSQDKKMTKLKTTSYSNSINLSRTN